MPAVTYPSSMVPGPPQVRVEVPDGWIQVWAPATLLAVREDAAAPDHFLANVIVRHHQRLAPFGDGEVLAELDGHAAQRAQGVVGPLRRRAVEGRTLVGAEVGFVDPQAGSVVQLHWFDLSPHGDVVDVLQLTGSFAGSRRQADESVIDAIVDSVRVGG